MSTGKAFRAALTEKYPKLAAEAKTHSNPENSIHSKYFDKSSESVSYTHLIPYWHLK